MDVQEFGAQVEDLEKKLDRLRALYEQYFQGIEKIEPTVLRHEVEKRFRVLRKERCHNTAVRFRFQTLIQRHTTLMSHWQRVCRAIEEGTYEPHVKRAQRMLEKEEAAKTEAERLADGRGRASVGDLVIDIDLGAAEEALEEIDAEPEPEAPPPARPATPTEPPSGPVARVRSINDLRALLFETDGPASAAKPAPAPAKPAPAARPAPASAAQAAAKPEPVAKPAPAAKPAPGSRPAAAPTGAGDDKVKAIHAAFADAARKAPAPVQVPSPDAIRKSLQKETERMSQKHPGQRVEFRVDVKDGKPIIKSFVVPAGGKQ